MKFECVTEKLRDVIAKIAKVAGKNLSLPILQCVFLEVREDSSRLILRTTNLELGVEAQISCKVLKKGVAAIPADILLSYINNLTDPSVVFEADGSNLTITSDHATTKIKLFESSEFPSLPRISDGVVVNLSQQKLVDGFKSVMYSTSPSSMKPELASIYLYPAGQSIVFVATDSFRLAEKIIPLSTSVSFNPLLIPYKNTVELTRLLSDEGKDEALVRVSENQIAFETESLYITSRIVDGSFPDYKQLIPKEHETTVTVLTRDLDHILRVSTIFSDKFNQITFRVIPSKGLEVKTFNSDVGEHTAWIDGSVEGVEISMSFNQRYISDVFASLSSESVSLFIEKGKPMIIHGRGDDSFTYLVMPMNR